MRKIKVGIIQQANVADMRINLMNLAKSIESCAAHGAQLVVLQELHNSLYFCQTENTQLFDLAEPIPGVTVALPGNTARCTSLMIRPIMRSFISLPEIWASNLSKRLWENWAFWFVGTSGIPKQHVSWR